MIMIYKYSLPDLIKIPLKTGGPAFTNKLSHRELKPGPDISILVAFFS